MHFPNPCCAPRILPADHNRDVERYATAQAYAFQLYCRLVARLSMPAIHGEHVEIYPGGQSADALTTETRQLSRVSLQAALAFMDTLEELQPKCSCSYCTAPPPSLLTADSPPLAPFMSAEEIRKLLQSEGFVGEQLEAMVKAVSAGPVQP